MKIKNNPEEESQDPERRRGCQAKEQVKETQGTGDDAQDEKA